MLVTGGTGFVGSHLVTALVGVGAHVAVLARRPGAPRASDQDPVVIVGDLTDRESLDAAVERARPELVFHLGAIASSGAVAARCVRVNVEGTVNLLGALAGVGYERLVHTSTSEVYGDAPAPFDEASPTRPRSAYGASKLAAELFCEQGHRNLGWPVVQLRVGTTYGPGQAADRLVPDVILHALRGEDVAMTSGTQTRELNDVADIVDGLLLAAVVDGIDGATLNLGNGVEVAVADAARQVVELMGSPIALRLGALPDRPGEPSRSFVDGSRARAELGWEPKTSLTEGLARTIAWYRERHA